jgi:hypothetical protein
MLLLGLKHVIALAGGKCYVPLADQHSCSCQCDCRVSAPVVVVSVILLWQTELEHVTKRAEPRRTNLKHVPELKHVTEREHDTKLKHVTERGKPMRVCTRASLNLPMSYLFRTESMSQQL